ncbi:hypothetical protein AAHC03_01565 [Spirometra sp. Aus1]
MPPSSGSNRNIPADKGAAGDAVKCAHETAAAGDEISIHSGFSAASNFSALQKPVTVYSKDLYRLRKFLDKFEKESK